MSEYSFETTLKECPVTIDGESYLLRELDGNTKGMYLKKMSTKVVLGPDGEIKSFTDYGGLETTLLGMCLYDPKDELVPVDVMQTWPSTALTSLFDLAQELSGLTEKSKKKLEDEAKNS